MRIGVLASHEGSVLQAVLDACAVAGTGARLCGRVSIVISNNSDSGALRRARDAGIPALHLSSATHPNPTSLDLAIAQSLDDARVDLVVLAGYMKRLGPETLARFANRLINTHPSLLPKFGGSGFFGGAVHAAVLAAGERESGATVHWVVGDYDTGPIIAQARVRVADAETPASLEAKVKLAERELLIETLISLTNRPVPPRIERSVIQ
jgi:phosphoribosylglycinamide formyltransferase 1